MDDFTSELSVERTRLTKNTWQVQLGKPSTDFLNHNQIASSSTAWCNEGENLVTPRKPFSQQVCSQIFFYQWQHQLNSSENTKPKIT